jgi:hypothetical protein
MSGDNVHTSPAQVDPVTEGKPTRTAGAPAPRSGSGAAAALGRSGSADPDAACAATS